MIVLSSSLIVPRRAAFADDDHDGIGRWVVEAVEQADRYRSEPAEVTAALVADRTRGDGMTEEAAEVDGG